MSPCIIECLKFFFNTSWQYGLFSTITGVSQPAHRAANEKPPMPANKLISAFSIKNRFRSQTNAFYIHHLNASNNARVSPIRTNHIKRIPESARTYGTRRNRSNIHHHLMPTFTPHHKNPITNLERGLRKVIMQNVHLPALKMSNLRR